VTKELLITTGIKETFVSQPFSKVLLGHWCKKYKDHEYWEKTSHRISSYHWDDRKKLKKDHEYLKNIYDEILNQLSFELNGIHNVKRPRSYWTLILGPWLAIYLPKIFDRWEILRSFYESDKNFSTVRGVENFKMRPPRDIRDCEVSYQTDHWNYEIFLDIIEKYYSEKTTFIDVKFQDIKTEEKKGEIKKGVVSKIISLINNLLLPITRDNEVFFYRSYFSLNKFFKLNYLLKQLPRLDNSIFDNSIFDNSIFDFSLRNKKIVIHSKSKFTDYLSNRIYHDMPSSYLENYSSIIARVDKLKYNPKVIFTSISHHNDDSFKIWAGEMVSRGKKLVLSHHGGAFPSLFCNLYREEDCSDIYITWFKPFNSQQKQLPPLKKHLRRLNVGSGDLCTILGYESSRYAYRAEAAPISFQSILCLNQVVTFCQNVNCNIKKKIKIRPYVDMGWNMKERYIQELGVKHVDDQSNYYSILNKSRIIICTYPQTTFSEAMASGKPTILLYKNDYFELIQETNDIVNQLKAAKIIFTNPLEAAEHINNIWSNVEEWWCNTEVLEARKAFYDIALRVDRKWTNEWVTLFKTLLNSQ
tara:strand:- start:7337 stop:9091 length:1755 start_codon:yes stop_codon:yes gene_type:complete